MALVGATGVLVSGQTIPNLQVPRDRGQDVSPTFDGWVTNPDGSYSIYFGYLNRNSAEDIYIPIGPDNAVDGAAGPDRGQPTFFYPGQQWWAYRSSYRKGVAERPADLVDAEITWSNERGEGVVAGEYEVDSVLVGMNATDRVLFSNLSEPDTNNVPPSISVSAPAPRMIGSSQRRRRSRSPQSTTGGRQATIPSTGVRFRWRVYRGPARVLFNPETTRTPSPSPAKNQTTVTFSEPGDYRLRVTASDGNCFLPRT